jgi:hypothetical protein
MIDWSHDRIGDRLAGVNLTDLERVLAADDKQRAWWVLDHASDFKTVIDIGASDGTFSKELASRGKRAFAIERHPAHQESLCKLGNVWVYFGEATDGLVALDGASNPETTVALLCEVLEHLDVDHGERILRAIPCSHLIVTVPNRKSPTYDKAGRSRWSWPDHRRGFDRDSLTLALMVTGWKPMKVEPIVGMYNDSIWLGAVCIR